MKTTAALIFLGRLDCDSPTQSDTIPPSYGLLWFFCIAGAISCAVYVHASSAYEQANFQAFEDLTPGFLIYVSVGVSFVLTIFAGSVALSRKRQGWRFWIAALICCLPMILFGLHAAKQARELDRKAGVMLVPFRLHTDSKQRPRKA